MDDTHKISQSKNKNYAKKEIPDVAVLQVDADGDLEDAIF